MPQVIIIFLGIVAVIITAIFEVLSDYWQPICAVILIVAIFVIAYKVYEFFYFKSSGFKNVKESIEKHINNCNELNSHIEELKNSSAAIKSNDYGESHLYDNSNYNFKRGEWNNNIINNKVHNCSATVCKNANDQPFKYLCKYFDIKINEESLSEFECLLNDFSAAEQGKSLLQNERDAVLSGVSNSIPALIMSFSKEKLIIMLGFEPVDLSDLYFPVYTFQYVSAGGNSSIKCDVKLNIENLDNFINYLNGLIKFKKASPVREH